jgi:hypothetical protein
MEQPSNREEFDDGRDHIKRPFTFDLEAWIARGFINACRKRGLFVRNTLKQLMIDFVNSSDKIDDSQSRHRDRDERHR